MKEKEVIGRALSYATIQYAKEKAKPNRLSAKKIADLVNQEHNVNLNPRTIRTRYIQMNKIGVAPTPKGPPPGLVEEETLVLLAQAFETHVCLNQINQEQRKNKCVSLLKSLQQQVISPY